MATETFSFTEDEPLDTANFSLETSITATNAIRKHRGADFDQLVSDHKVAMQLRDSQADAYGAAIKSKEDETKRKGKQKSRQTNPYEGVLAGKINNHAGIKLAELDCIFTHHMPKMKEGTEVRVVDICAAPGSFSNHMLCRYGYRAEVFAVSITEDKKADTKRRNYNTYKAKHFYPAGRKSMNGDLRLDKPMNFHAFEPARPLVADNLTQLCDMTHPVYQEAFIDWVESFPRAFAPQKGVHGNTLPHSRTGNPFDAAPPSENKEAVDDTSSFADIVISDGGFDTQKSAIEVLSFELILAECLCGTRLLKTGGMLICKMFGVSHFLTQYLYALLRAMFDAVELVKPLTSRPASNEIYLVALGRLDRSIPKASAALQHLLNLRDNVFQSCGSQPLETALQRALAQQPPAATEEQKSELEAKITQNRLTLLERTATGVKTANDKFKDVYEENEWKEVQRTCLAFSLVTMERQTQFLDNETEAIRGNTPITYKFQRGSGAPRTVQEIAAALTPRVQPKWLTEPPPDPPLRLLKGTDASLHPDARIWILHARGQELPRV